MVYKPGKQNIVADAITRRQDFICLIESKEVQEDIANIPSLDKWRTACFKCTNFQLPYEKTVANYSEGRELLAVLCMHREYIWDGNLLWARLNSGSRVCVHQGGFMVTLLEQIHVLAGHPGIDKNRTALRALFWRPKITDDKVSFVQSRVACARGKSSGFFGKRVYSK